MTAITEPGKFAVGDNLQWQKTIADYPATDWTLNYSLMNADYAYDFAASADGQVHVIDVPSATTVAWQPGRYTWVSYVSDGTSQVSIGTGIWSVAVNPALATPQDLSSHARKMLDAIEAALESRATAGQLDLVKSQIGDRAVDWKRENLISLRDKYRAEVIREENGGGVGLVKLILR